MIDALALATFGVDFVAIGFCAFVGYVLGIIEKDNHVVRTLLRRIFH